MSGDIGVGDLVECVEANGFGGPEVGRLYCVEWVTPELPCDCVAKGIRPWAFEHTGYALVGGPSTGDPDLEWCGYMFRPISRRSSFESFLAEIKTPIQPDNADAPSERVGA